MSPLAIEATATGLAAAAFALRRLWQLDAPAWCFVLLMFGMGWLAEFCGFDADGERAR